MLKLAGAVGFVWLLVLGAASDAAKGDLAGAAPATRPSAVDVRFATRFCYRQHNNQTDVTRCLARYLAR